MANNKTDSDFDAFLEDLRKIQQETLSLNESDEEKDASDEDTKKKEDNSSEGDIDELLKGSDEDTKDSKKDEDDGLDDLPDLSDLDSKESDKKEENDKEDSSSDTNKSFETDNEGLADTITKLAKEGHKVTITVTSEGRQYFIGKKKVTPKQIMSLAEIVLPKTKESENARMMKSLMEQISALKTEIRGMKSGSMKPVQETKYIRISEDNYNALNEMVSDMKFTIDEQKMIIKNYEAMNTLTENDEDISKMFDDLSEDINTLNNLTGKSTISEAYNRASNNMVDIMSADVLPMLASLSEAKASILAELDSGKQVRVTFDNDIRDSLKQLDENIASLDKFNMLNRFTTLVESKLANVADKGKIMTALSEASSEIVNIDGDPGYPTDFPKAETFAQRIQKTLNAAALGINRTSQIAANYPEDNDFNKSSLRKFDIPIARPEVNDNITVRSAIMNLQEALVDIDGNINFDLCEQAYLYKKVSNPSSLKDFAFPIAISENGNLVAVPRLIETAAQILANDSCIRTYGIDSRETFYNLREDLEVFLNKINADIPWKDTITLEEVKRRSAKKKGKCKKCGAECEGPEDCDTCPECEEMEKKEAKKANKSSRGKKK